MNTELTVSPDIDSPDNSEYEITPKVGAIIVTYNRRDDVIECIDSLLKSTYPELTVYVIDNSSEDGTSEAISGQYPQVVLIESNKNLGFSEGNNVVLARALQDGMDAVFLLNDDAVVKDDAIQTLVDVLYQYDEIGVVSPKISLYSDPEVIWSAGGVIEPDNGIATQRHYGETDCGQADSASIVDYAVGCAMLIKSDIVRTVGGIDPRYFMYYEEADWCRRIRDAGYLILYVPKSQVLHKVSLQSNGRNNAPYYMSRNRLLYLRSGGVRADRVAWIAISEILRSAAGHAAKGRSHESRLMIRAVVDYFGNNNGMLGSNQ